MFEVFVVWVANLTANLGAAGAFAVFNSARINAYRREAASARKVGNYLLVQRLGGGGMGEVYLAEHQLLKRPCAIKLIRPERAGDATFARGSSARCRDHAAQSPHGRRDLRLRPHRGRPFLLRHGVPAGPDPRRAGRGDGPLPPARVVHLLRQVCGALRAAHRLGLIHRDIKPGNVMACRRGSGRRGQAARLRPGGRRRAAEDQRLTQVGGILGTPAYMSPEQARGEPDVDAASDIYSLGAVAYFLLTGRPPFQGYGGLEVLNAH